MNVLQQLLFAVLSPSESLSLAPCFLFAEDPRWCPYKLWLELTTSDTPGYYSSESMTNGQREQTVRNRIKG